MFCTIPTKRTSVSQLNSSMKVRLVYTSIFYLDFLISPVSSEIHDFRYVG